MRKVAGTVFGSMISGFIAFVAFTLKDLFLLTSKYLASEKGDNLMAKHFVLLYEETQTAEEVCMEALNELKGN